MSKGKNNKKRLSKEHKHIILEKNISESVTRSSYLSYVYALCFGFFGISSTIYLKEFIPTLTVWENLWPRLLFNTIPFLLLGYFLPRIRLSPERKLILWVASFAVIIHAASWVHVWPIVISGHPEVFTYVHAANIFLTTTVFIVLAPPPVYLPAFMVIIGLAFWLPLIYVASEGGNHSIFTLVWTDTCMATVLQCWAAYIIYSLRDSVARLEFERLEHAGEFLGARVSKAIFENRPDLLKEKKSPAFILMTDLRGFTRFVNSPEGNHYLDLLEKYHSTVVNAVTGCGGTIHKTMGDGHLISFGLCDDIPDLSDVPIAKLEIEEARIRRNQDLLVSAIRAYGEIIREFEYISSVISSPEVLQIGGAIDFGEVEMKVVGSKSRRELDIFGNVVNRCTRLENLGKSLINSLECSVSLLVISPHASEFLNQKSGFYKQRVAPGAVRDFPDIQWVMVKEFEDNHEYRKIVLPMSA